ncbi:hypothetical protein SDC9_129612 [bioreactor metagenome]|uniref:Uncharacterized protein n=1 Tax=bioreactor metagenome TaxID=1076179 RepID=A0A645D0A3_9ZZZZ
MLEIPKEKHLGPKLASKVSRDLVLLTAGVENPKERSRIRAQYLKSLEDARLSKVALIFEARTLKQDLKKRNELDTSRKVERVTFVDKFAENMYWRTKKVEAKSMRTRLERELYRLKRAEQNPKKNQKIVYWRAHYERRVKEYESLKNSIENKIVNHSVKAEIEGIKTAILNKENPDQSKLQYVSQGELLKELYPDITSKELKSYATYRIDKINKELTALQKETKIISRKIRTDAQIKAIIESRVSRGLIRTMAKDHKRLLDERRQLKAAMLEFNSRPASEQIEPWKVDLELSRLHDWEDAVNDLSASISSRRYGWDIQKTKPETQQLLVELQMKFVNRNDKIVERLKEIKETKFKLYHERSEWRKLSYSTNRTGEIGRLVDNTMSKLKLAVSRLRDARGRGRIGVRLAMDDDYSIKNAGQEYE